jgi:hypothetical protein
LHKIIGFGASHIDCVGWAWETRCERQWEDVSLTVLRFRDYDNVDFDSKLGVGSKFLQCLTREVEDPYVRSIFCSVGGGDHVAVGLLNAPRPFDVMIPAPIADKIVCDAQAGPKPDFTRDIIPFDLMKSNFSWRIGGIARIFKTVRALSELPLYCIAPPPPIRNDKHMASVSNPEFRKELERLGLNDPIVYYKVWLINKLVMREFCEAYGASFIDVPAQALGPDGFLRDEFFLPNDPMHANAAYGALVIDQLVQLTLINP